MQPKEPPEGKQYDCPDVCDWIVERLLEIGLDAVKLPDDGVGYGTVNHDAILDLLQHCDLVYHDPN